MTAPGCPTLVERDSSMRRQSLLTQKDSRGERKSRRLKTLPKNCSVKTYIKKITSSVDFIDTFPSKGKAKNTRGLRAFPFEGKVGRKATRMR